MSRIKLYTSGCILQTTINLKQFTFVTKIVRLTYIKYFVYIRFMYYIMNRKTKYSSSDFTHFIIFTLQIECNFYKL